MLGVVSGLLGFAFGVVLAAPGFLLAGGRTGPMIVAASCTLLIGSALGALAWATVTGRDA